MIKLFHPRGVQELIWKAGRTTEKVTQRRLFKKFPGQKVKAQKLAQLKGLKKVKALGKRYGVEGLGVSLKGPKIKPTKLRHGFFTSEESKSMTGLTSMRFAKRKGLPTEPREGFDPWMGSSIGFRAKDLKKGLKISKGKIKEFKGGTTVIERITHSKAEKAGFFVRKKFYSDPKWKEWKLKLTKKK
jgi:hypothetical protein